MYSFCSKNSDHFEVFPINGACIWMVSEICSLTYMNRQPSHLEGWNHAEAARLLKKNRQESNLEQNRQMSHHFEDKSPCLEYLQFSLHFSDRIYGWTTMTDTTQRLGWQPRAWFTPGWFTSGFCWWMTSAVESESDGWNIGGRWNISPPKKNIWRRRTRPSSSEGMI